MLHIFAQIYFIFSQCTFHVLKHCVVLWLNTQKNLLERMQTGFVIRTHMGKKSSTDIAAFSFFLFSDAQKTRNSKTNLKLTNTVLLLFFSFVWPRYDSLSWNVFFISRQSMPNTTSQVSTMTEWFPFTWDHEAHGTKSCTQKYLNSKYPSLLLLWCILFCFCMTVN